MQKLWTYCFMAFVFFGCKKHKDNTPPMVNITLPLENSTVNAGTFIHVTGTVTDDQKLETVTINVLSLSGNTQIANPVTLTPQGTFYNVDVYVKVGDLHTTTNTYQVIVEANDGTNKKKAFKEINVVEIPRVLKKIIVVRNNGSGFAVDSLVGTGFSNFILRTSDFSGAAVSNYYQQLFLCGKTSGVLESWDLVTNMPKWTVAADLPSSTVPLFYFTEFNAAELSLWESFATTGGGTLKTLGATGSVSKNLTMQPSHYAAAELSIINNYVIAESPEISGGTAYLSYYFANGFGLNHTTPMPFAQTKKLFALSDHEVVVIGNNAAQGELRVFDSNTNGFWEQFDIPVGRIYDAVQIDAENYIIAHETGLIKYTHSPANLINITTGNKAQLLNFDQYSGIVWAGEGNFVKAYDPLTGVTGTVYMESDSVKSVLLQYNK
jgi:hypothetical protein